MLYLLIYMKNPWVKVALGFKPCYSLCLRAASIILYEDEQFLISNTNT